MARPLHTQGQGGKGMDAKRKDGFTLIEVMIVVVIITIIALIALPAFRTFAQKYRIRSYCYDVISLMNRARIRAIESRQPHTLTIDFDNEEIRVSPALPSGSSEAEAPSGVDVYAIADDLSVTNPSKMSGTTTKTIMPSGSYLTGTVPDNFKIFFTTESGVRYHVTVYALTGNLSVEGNW
ncbi:MAG: prepilin-type N-terminal cleavage/methylation domain-containing protein [Deltaproteobacteria bacterium]|nr:MAG: prepilin-type N-terminal cleavage/methylation domain-containing protein [Deltaproteobacteria bacterium]